MKINLKNINLKKRFISIVILTVIFGADTNGVLAQTAQISQSSLFIPLIGITSVPNPLVLSQGPGNVTYSYAVKNFLNEVALNNIEVVDDKCNPVKFVEGDDNGDSKLDYNETWRYTCTTKLSKTTESIATATGIANNISAAHKAYATVVVGLDTPAPLVSIVNITKVAYPLSLPTEGGKITYTYKVNNPGVVPLNDVTVADDKCNTMSGKLGDTNGNNLLDTHEVWIYTCTTILKQTTTNTVAVTAFANGLKAIDSATITVVAKTPEFPEAGLIPNFKITVWKTLSGVLAVLIVFFALARKSKYKSFRKRWK